MDAFRREFLCEETLLVLFVHACKSCRSFYKDPVSDIAAAMLRAPVCAVFTPSGLAPFRDLPNIALPYAYMSQAQRDHALRLLAAPARLARRCASVEVRLDHSPEHGAPQLPPSAVLLCMCRAVLSGSGDKREGQKRLALCNVLLQRVRCVVQLPHELFAQLHARLASLFPQIVQTSPPPPAAAPDAAGPREAA